MKVYANVKDVAETLYGPRCESADDPAVVIRYDADTALTVFASSPDESEVCVRARVGSLRGLDNPGDLCEAALQGNLFWKGTGGATLSLGQDEMALYLTDRCEAEALADEESLTAFLEDFVAMVNVWRARLDLYRPEGADADGKEGL